MSRKNNLLSIGDLSKITGVGVKSLRYYERINVLIPAYISADSGYRYYTLDQANLVEMIQFCIELDIPLSELTHFIDSDGIMNLKGLFAKGRSVAEKKIAKLKKGLKLISTMEEQMALSEQYKIGKAYAREIPEKHFFVKPYAVSLKDADKLEIIKSLFELPYEEDDDYEMWEFGFMCEVTQDERLFYAFAEVPKYLSNKTIPGGKYVCSQHEESALEMASENMQKNAIKNSSYIAIETEIISNKRKLNRPITELRFLLKL